MAKKPNDFLDDFAVSQACKHLSKFFSAFTDLSPAQVDLLAARLRGVLSSFESTALPKPIHFAQKEVLTAALKMAEFRETKTPPLDPKFSVTSITRTVPADATPEETFDNPFRARE